MRVLRQLFLIYALIFPLSLAAQISLPGLTAPVADKKQEANAETIDQKRERILAQIADAERRRSEAHSVRETYQGEQALSANEQQRLLDRLVVVEQEKLKRLNELETIQQLPQPGIDSLPQVRELSGPPPYSPLRVDALRDTLDSMYERVKIMNAGLQALEEEKPELGLQRRRAAEAIRLAEDQLARARSDEESIKQRWAKTLAALQQQLADAELLTISLRQDALKHSVATLRKNCEELKQFIERVLPGQRFTEADMEEVRNRGRNGADKIKLEIDTTVAAYGKRLAERDRLLKAGVGQRGESDEKALRLRFLDEALETDLVVLRGLSGLQELAHSWTEAWEQRYQALGGNAETRRLARAELEKISAPLSSRKRSSNEQRDSLRLAIRGQEQRLVSALPDSPESRYANELLVMLQKRSAMFDRIEVVVGNFERQLTRWQDDLGGGENASLRDQLVELSGDSMRWLGMLWHYELFTVEDFNEVDGHKVPVSYGVTVDKSVGALLLIVLGYWLLLRISRTLQRVLVRRFGVEEQLAQVLRRWLVIFLAVVLIVFVLNLARIPLTVFAFLGGALAIGVGFGTQTIIKNLISGIIILFERKIRVGDIVNVGGTIGHVVAVDLRATTIRAFDGVEALVPNSILLENQVVNWTYSSSSIRREIKIGVAYGTDMRLASRILSECADAHPHVQNEPPPEVFFEDYGDSALLLILVYWVDLGSPVGGRRVDSDLRFSIGERFAEAAIAVPFPQRELRLEMSSPLPVRVTTS